MMVLRMHSNFTHLDLITQRYGNFLLALPILNKINKEEIMREVLSIFQILRMEIVGRAWKMNSTSSKERLT